MSRSSKRKPDMRKIRPTKTYTITELAKRLDKSEATIRDKISAWGLCIDVSYPPQKNLDTDISCDLQSVCPPSFFIKSLI